LNKINGDEKMENEINELKAKAYDLIVVFEKIQYDLKIINQRIIELQNKPKTNI
jgi:hypothetical protein